MKFDKNNLLLFVDNSYKGKLLKTRDNRLKSTKSDAENHGVGLASVYRAVVISYSVLRCVFRVGADNGWLRHGRNVRMLPVISLLMKG